MEANGVKLAFDEKFGDNSLNKANADFYEKAINYWKSIPATVDGVLGGFGHISKQDISDSHKFLKELFKLGNPPGKTRALDCGAGIGRVTKHLLMKYFCKVDLIDQNEDFVQKAKEYIGEENQLGKLYSIGLQNFVPEEKYDLVWCQWVLGHLTDFDFIKFMKICRSALNKNGIVVVKENVSSCNESQLDEIDSSITRPAMQYFSLFEQAEFDVLHVKNQTGFPKALYPVKMIALRSKHI